MIDTHDTITIDFVSKEAVTLLRSLHLVEVRITTKDAGSRISVTASFVNGQDVDLQIDHEVGDPQ